MSFCIQVPRDQQDKLGHQEVPEIVAQLVTLAQLANPAMQDHKEGEDGQDLTGLLDQQDDKVHKDQKVNRVQASLAIVCLQMFLFA